MTDTPSLSQVERGTRIAGSFKPMSSLEVSRLQRSAPKPKFDGARAPMISQYAPDGKATPSDYANGKANCGPTSMAIIARACGKDAALSNSDLVTKLRTASGTGADGASAPGVAAMAKALGFSSTALGPDTSMDSRLAAIRDAVDTGKPVLVKGDYYSLPWRQNYTNADSKLTGEANDPEGHFVAIVGVNEQGQYLVRDPATADDRVTPMSREQVEHFLAQNSRRRADGTSGHDGMVYVLSP